MNSARGRFVISVPSSLKHRDFRRHLGGVFISQVGDQTQGFALAIGVYVQTHDKWATCAVAMVRLLTLALGTWIGGRFTDRFARRTLLVRVQLPLIAVPAYLCWWSFQHGSIPLVATYILLMVVYILMAMEGNAQSVISQSMVLKGEVENAIYITSMTRNLAFTMGSLGSGLLLIFSESMGWLFAFNAFSYIPLLIFYLGMSYGRMSTFVPAASQKEDAPKVSYREAKAYLRTYNPTGFRGYRWTWMWHLTMTNGQVMYILIAFNLLGGTSAYTAIATTSAISGGIITLVYSGFLRRSSAKRTGVTSLRPMLAWGCVLAASSMVVGMSQVLWVSLVAMVFQAFGIYRVSNVLFVLMQCGTRPEEAASRAYEGRVKGLPVISNALGGAICNVMACVIIEVTGDVRAVAALTFLGLLCFLSGLIVEVRYELLLFLVLYGDLSERGFTRCFTIYRWINARRLCLILRLHKIFLSVVALIKGSRGLYSSSS